MPNQTGHIYLVTSRHGQCKLAILSRPASNGDMHGLLSMRQIGRGAQLTPVAAPIVFSPLRRSKPAPALGRIGQGNATFTRYRSMLKPTVDETFAAFLTP